MHCIAEAQKNGGLGGFIDAEHAFDKNMLKIWALTQKIY
jgi:RecA/RadA recombinase